MWRFPCGDPACTGCQGDGACVWVVGRKRLRPPPVECEPAADSEPDLLPPPPVPWMVPRVAPPPAPVAPVGPCHALAADAAPCVKPAGHYRPPYEAGADPHADAAGRTWWGVGFLAAVLDGERGLHAGE